MTTPAELRITEIDASEIPPAFRSPWAEVLEKCMKLRPGRTHQIEGAPFASVHTIRNQIKRADLPLAITARKRTIFVTRLRRVRRAA